MSNQDLREYATAKGVRLWKIAHCLGMNDGNFSRKLRFEFSEDQKAKIKAIIDNLSVEQ